MSLVDYCILIIAVLGAGSIALFIKESNTKLLQLALSFGGSFLLGICFLHLIPEVYELSDSSIGMFVLGGFLLQLFLEQFSGGVEHGHIHAMHHPKISTAISIMFGLCIHSFIEGMPLAHYSDLQIEGHQHNHLLYGVVLHKIPAAFALALLLKQSKFSNLHTALFLLVFALMSPIGALLSDLFIISVKHITWITGIVVGSFLHISTTILFEADTDREHHVSWQKIIIILIGVGLAILTRH